MASIAAQARLTRRERERGWAVFACPEHGFLVATTADAVVSCGEKNGTGKRCGKKAQKS